MEQQSLWRTTRPSRRASLYSYSRSRSSIGAETAACVEAVELLEERVVLSGSNTFATASVIAAGDGSMAVVSTGSNVGATKEVGEPNHAGNAGGKSVWWSWTAPVSGTVQIDTIGSSFDTTLGIYTGAAVPAVNALTKVASDDDSGGSKTSKTSFVATLGKTYYIAVDGFGGKSGSIKLTVGAVVAPVGAPANDNIANAVVFTPLVGQMTGTNVASTKETNEPTHGSKPATKSVWWSWTPDSTGTVTIDTALSSFDTSLSVYTSSTPMGPTMLGLTSVADNNDVSVGVKTSKVTFTATSGVTYFIAVDDGNSGQTGSIKLNVSAITPLPVTPANDNIAAATVVTATTMLGSNALATKETGEPNHAGRPATRSVWFAWTPTTGGMVTIDTAGSSFDTLLAVYTNTSASVTGLTSVASNDDAGGGLRTSKVTFTAIAGQTYYIAVDGFGGAFGNIKLNLSSLLQPPPPAT